MRPKVVLHGKLPSVAKHLIKYSNKVTLTQIKKHALRSKVTLSFSLQYCCSIAAVLLQYCCSIAAVLLQYCCSIAAVLLQYCCSIAAVLLQYCCSIAAVLLQYCCSIAAVLLQYSIAAEGHQNSFYFHL